MPAIACVVLAGFPAGALLQAAPAAEGIDFFEKRIRPLLVEKCYECHTEGKKMKGGLALDHREALQHGGDSGAVVVPGNPDKSKLIEAVRYQNRDLQMPPKGALTAEQVADLEAWVKMGAPDPREKIAAVASSKPHGMSAEEGRKFWSFMPLSNPAQPAVKHTAWVKTPVDAFILAELEKTGLQPAPRTDKRTLIRRATFDLTGLPPTPDEVDAFLSDASPDAFEKVVDRLLASPEYGERWGRHWLDVARYADSNGMDENVAYGHAWRYRDYVVRAFNDDKPYDQFVIEQLAGDLLPASEQKSREDCLAATGFLALGGKVLAEPDVRKLEMDIIDEQLDTLGKAFLGMTFGCARCHDHKFDPISSTDYYSLAAIFRSTRSLADEKMGAIKFWFEHSMATPEQLEAKKKHEALVKEQTAKVAKFSAETRAKLKEDLHSHAADYLAAAAELPDDPDYAAVQSLAAKRGLRARYLLTCRLYLERNSEHPFFEKWRELAAAGKTEEVRTQYAKLFADAAVALKEAKAKEAPVKETPPKSPPAKGAKAAEAKDVKPADPALAAAHDALNDIAGFLAIPDKDADAFDETMLSTASKMKDELMALEDKTPDPPALMGVRDGTVTKTLPIHLRGSYLTLGKEVERGFPEVMRVSLTRPVLPAKQSGRLELARWMASSEHPLTARVMVNRVWRWHFGRGIVGSTDNFGILGDKPSHPALLDWLARTFMEDGWSVKDMHRLIMKSSVYQQSSGQAEDENRTAGSQAEEILAERQAGRKIDARLVDPENKLLSHANIQRLEAEEVRDAMLAACGSLSKEVGGKTIPLRNREFVFNHTSKDHTTYESPRRALYLPIIRNHLYDMLEQFDYPDPTMPTGSRNSTVVAPQALIMLNSPVAMDCADQLAANVCHASPSDEARVQLAYTTLYARPASAHEAARAVAFVNKHSDRQEAWALLCHTLMAANEFMYLR